MVLSCHIVNESNLGVAKEWAHLITIDDPTITNIKIDFFVPPMPRARSTQPCATCLQGSKNGCMGITVVQTFELVPSPKVEPVWTSRKRTLCAGIRC